MADPIPPNSRKEQNARARAAYSEPVLPNPNSWAYQQLVEVYRNAAPRAVIESGPRGPVFRFEYDAETAERIGQLQGVLQMESAIAQANAERLRICYAREWPPVEYDYERGAIRPRAEYRTGGRYYEMGDTGGVFYPDRTEYDEPETDDTDDE